MEIILAIVVIALLLVVVAAAVLDGAAHARRHRGPTVAEIRARLDAEAARTVVPLRG